MYGSLQNQMAGEANRPGEAEHQWKVGDGATLVMWTDRQAFTVIDVSKDGKTITLQRDKAYFTPGSMGTSVDRYEQDTDGATYVAKHGAAGWRTVNESTGRYGKKAGYRVITGRSEYHDPSF